MRRPVAEIGEFGEGAAGNHVGPQALDGFDAAADDAHVFQFQFNRGLLQKRSFFSVGIQKRNLQIGAADGGGNARLPAAGTDVEHGLRAFEVGRQGQAVEQVVADDLRLVAQGGEVVGFIPFFQHLDIGEQLVLLFAA